MLSFVLKRIKNSLPPLRFFNTLSAAVEQFVPLSSPVRMYNCGPTVYDHAHVGNLRSYIFADTIRRALLAWGFKVRQVINITDFGHLTSDADEGEDKMSKGLRREGLTISMTNMRVLADTYTRAFIDDIEILGLDVRHILFPRASEYVLQQIDLVKKLQDKGYAYKTQDGIYFDTHKFSGYGALGRIDLSGQEAGARVSTAGKRNPQDFALWKFSARGGSASGGDHMGWESPWGRGFPGWHIECTAMVFALLGQQIDIHTGGVDHIPVHHNNEIAQAQALTGEQYVKYWMHNEFANLYSGRIGKSEGNAITLKDVVARGIHPVSLRYFYLTGHYRTPMTFSWEALQAAEAAMMRLARAYRSARSRPAQPDILKKFYAAIADDLNTAKALGIVWENIGSLNRTTLDQVDDVLGLGLKEIAKHAPQPLRRDELPEEVRRFVAEREIARGARDFPRADALRLQIEKAGYTLKDTPEGPEITRK
ncbi:MAG: cysteine--tRNA ligase [Patescibacteria group bacterium]|nr:cysteine--tRNA ligase [Patescibacteria group bacterium]